MDEFPKDFISKGAVEYVFTTHVTHQEQFYVHLDSHSSILEDIMDALENRYTDLGANDKTLAATKLGGLCAAKFTDDNNWYRAKITGLIHQNGLVEVQFVDYGNTDYVNLDRIKALDPDLVQYPVQSYRCALSGVSCDQGFWPPELMVQFEDLVVDKKCKAVFQGKRDRDEVYLIDMYDEQGNYVNKMFGATEPARSVQSHGDASVKATVNQNGSDAPGFQPLVWKAGDKIQASIVYVESPNLFWCQDVAFLNNIIILSEDLSRQHMTQEMNLLKNIKPGAICAAKFAEDEAWYRGIVQSISKNSASVYFVDYGNTEIVGLDSICDLNQEFRQLPALGIKCSLANMKPEGKSWSEDIVNEFEGMVMDKEFEIKVLGKQGSVYDVTLLDVEENRDIGNHLQQLFKHKDSKAQTTPKERQRTAPKTDASPRIGLSIGGISNVFLSWVRDPSDFYVQLAETSPSLDELSDELQEYYSQPQAKGTSYRGEIVIARFSEDQQWYRAVIKQEMEQTVTVEFFDYGNSDTVPKSELRQLNPKFSKLDPLAFKCSLAGVKALPQDNTWSVDAKHLLEELTNNGCQCEVIRKNEGIHLVKLSVGGKDVAKELISSAVVADSSGAYQSKSTPAYYPACIKLFENQSENVVVTHVDSPHNLWIQLDKNFDQLDSLMGKLDSHYSEDGGIPISKPAVGLACVAKYSVDEAWYRAVIVNITASGYEVRFVDYGNAEVVSPNLVCVPEPRFLDLPPQAIQCSLSLPGNQEHLTDVTSDMTLEKTLQMKVLSIKGGLSIVELMENSQSITDLLKQKMGDIGGSLTLAPPKNIPFGSTFNAFVSVVLTPSKFFLQMAGIDEELDSLMTQITNLYSHEGISTIAKPAVGTFCVALYQEDQQWYRGKITQVQGQECSVLFVDYGNEEIIGNKFIKELSPEISDVPILAYECSLEGVVAEDWTESAIENFESLVMDQELSCTFSSNMSVSVICNGENVAEKLIAAGYGKSSKISAAPSAGFNAGGSWKQDRSPDASRPSAWEDKPPRKSGFDKSPQKFDGSSNGFGRRDDRGFGRRDDGGGFGKCDDGGAFGGRRDFSGDATNESLKKSGFGQKDGGFRRERNSGFGGGDLQDRKPNSSSTQESFNYGDPPSEPEDAILIHIDDDGTFYLQLLSMEKDILFLAKRLAGSYKSGGPRLRETPVKGTICCCKFPDDGNMYRSLVEDVKGDNILVRYVDFGNTAQCNKNDLKFLFPDLLQYSVQAYPCKLGGFTWSLEKAELFGRAALDKDLKVTFTSASPPFLVDISTPDGNLLDIMEGKAAPPQKHSPKPSSFGSSTTTSFGGSKTSPSGGVKTSPKQSGFNKNTKQGFGSSSPKQAGSGSPFKKALNFESPSMPSLPSQVFIDQTIPSGPQTAYISHVSEDGYFYLQLDKDTEVLETLTDKLTSLSPNTMHPNLKAGVACAAVFSEDSAWYRAKILSQEAEKYKVLFVDFGNGDTVTKSNIRPLTSELLKSPPLSYQCLFSDAETLSKEAQVKLSEYLLEHQMTVQFGNQKTPFSVSATLGDGQNLQDIVYPSNKFRSQRIPNDVTPAGVSHIEEEGRFFLQLYKDYKGIEELQNSLQNAYTSADIEPLSSQEAETPCCVKSSEDEKWYRGRILQVTDSNAHICHVDFGHTVSVALDGVKNLLPEFVKKPPFAIECRLKGVDSWTEDLLAKFTEMTNEKILNATFHNNTPPFRVSLARSIELDLLGLKGPILDSPRKTSPDGNASASLLSAHMTFGEEAYITEVENGGQFYVQMASREEELQALSDKLESSLSSAEQPASVQEGQLLGAKFSEDDAWYRAIVEKVDEGEQYTVRFIDYGNTDCIGKDKLAILPEDMGLDRVQPFAFKSELACQPKLASDLVEKLKDLVVDKPVAVKVISDTGDKLCMVQIYLEGQAITDILGLQTSSAQAGELSSILENFESALESNTTSNGDRITVTVSYVDRPSKFYIQFEKNQPALDCMMDELFEHVTNLPEGEGIIDDLNKGDFVAALYEDESWYRVKVEDINDDGSVQVFYIDHGNTEIQDKTSLRQLPDRIKELPVFSKESSLFGIKPVDTDWTDEAIETFKSMVEEKSLLADLICQDKVPFVVQLLDMGTPVHQTLIERGFGTETGALPSSVANQIFSDASESILEDKATDDSPAKEKIRCISQTVDELKQVAVYVSHSDNPSQFWCQLASSADILDEISDILQSAYSDQATEEDKSNSDLMTNDVVAARFTEDQLYYRSVVLSSDINGDDENEHTVLVRFIDYGNCSSCSKEEVFKLRENFYKYPAQAFQCCLDGISPIIGNDWSSQASNRLSELVTDQELLMKLVGKNQDGVALVELVAQESGKSIAADLVEENLAKFLDPSDSNLQPPPSESVQDNSAMESLEITHPIMESTAMVHDTTSMMYDTSDVEDVSLEEAFDGRYKIYRLRRHCNYDVYVSDDELPNAFCVQLKKYKNQYTALMAEIAEYSSSDEAKDSSDWVIKSGEPCLVWYMDDWYRGLIRDRNDSDGWMVRSVDCGWDVSVDVSKIKEIPDRFMELPTQSIPCYLAGIVSVEPNWEDSSLAFFSDFCRDRPMCIYVLEAADDGKYGVFMNDIDTSTSQSLNRAFVDIGYAEIVPGSYIDVTFDAEKTLNTDGLIELEESFNEVKLGKKDDFDGNETDDFQDAESSPPSFHGDDSEEKIDESGDIGVEELKEDTTERQEKDEPVTSNVIETVDEEYITADSYVTGNMAVKDEDTPGSELETSAVTSSDSSSANYAEASQDTSTSNNAEEDSGATSEKETEDATASLVETHQTATTESELRTGAATVDDNSTANYAEASQDTSKDEAEDSGAISEKEAEDANAASDETSQTATTESELGTSAATSDDNNNKDEVESSDETSDTDADDTKDSVVETNEITNVNDCTNDDDTKTAKEAIADKSEELKEAFQEPVHITTESEAVVKDEETPDSKLDEETPDSKLEVNEINSEDNGPANIEETRRGAYDDEDDTEDSGNTSETDEGKATGSIVEAKDEDNDKENSATDTLETTEISISGKSEEI